MKKIITSLIISYTIFIFDVFAQETIHYSENWEGDVSSWTTADNNPFYWHLDIYNAYGGSGESWWMADPSLGNNGGYADEWYQVLDTNPISLTGENLQLTFYHRYSVEAVGGGDYDGWDGMNLRISTDQGVTWQILTSVSPGYNCTSMYGFGFIHNEGPGIPGWGGDLLDWTEVTADLSDYSGQTAIIRFAFGSDPNTSTISGGAAAAMFGWQVDNIIVSNSVTTLFSNNGSAENLFPHNRFGGDLWHIAVEGGENHFANCNNEANTYLKGMENSIISDSIHLPDVESIKMDFKLRGTFEDNDVNPPPGPPQYDYFSAYIYVFDELRNITNINFDGVDEVFYNAPSTWTLYSEAYDENFDREPVDLSPLRGQTIQLIFKFTSDRDEPIGEAIQIDDIKIFTPGAVSVESSGQALNSFSLGQNYPNPFNPVTNIKFGLPLAGNVKIRIYNLLGEEVMKLLDNEYEAGFYKIELNAAGLSSGVYIYRMETTNFVDSKKFVLLK